MGLNMCGYHFAIVKCRELMRDPDSAERDPVMETKI